MAGQQQVASTKGGPDQLVQYVKHNFRKPQQMKVDLDGWLKRQSPATEALAAAVGGSMQGAFFGGLMGSITKVDPAQLQQSATTPGMNSELMKQMQTMQRGGPLVQARNFAVMTGSNAGLSLALKRWRGKEDAYTTMAAAFGSGALFALVSGFSGGNALQGAFSTGVCFALFQGAFYKLSKKFGAPKKGDLQYSRASHLMTTLGFPEYEKNLQKARLTDNTIWLWDNSALQDARIPPGPRLLILNHVDHYRNVLKPAYPVPRPMPSPGAASDKR